MDSEDLLQEYSDSIRTLRKQCLDAGMSEDEFRKLYFDSLHSLDQKIEHDAQSKWVFMKRRRALFVLSILLVYFLFNYQTIYTYFVCSLQEYIHPGLKYLRRLAVPFISLFPSLSAYYHETCLIQNPFFTIVDMDCWPCSSIQNVKEIFNPEKPITEQTYAPFIYETDQPVISINELKEIYVKNKISFDKESKIFSDSTLEHFFVQSDPEQKLYIWKFNNIDISRILRQIIPRPKIVPKFGQSTERFIIIDTSKESFKVPDTECTFSFLLALHGNRNINLTPAEECKHQCKTLKIELKETYLLWYNWWYWRPVVLPSSSNVTFIAHVGSYC